MLSLLVKKTVLPATYRGLSSGVMFRFSEDKEDNNGDGSTN